MLYLSLVGLDKSGERINIIRLLASEPKIYLPIQDYLDGKTRIC